MRVTFCKEKNLDRSINVGKAEIYNISGAAENLRSIPEEVKLCMGFTGENL